MADTNTTVIRWLAGGTLTINDGSSTLTVKNIGDDDTLTITVPMPNAPIEYWDRDVPQTPRRGKLDYGQLEIEAAFASHATDPDLDAFCNASASSGTGTVKTYTVTLTNFDAPGASTGKKYTLTTAFLSEPITHTLGGSENKLDKTRVVFKAVTGPTPARV